MTSKCKFSLKSWKFWHIELKSNAWLIKLKRRRLFVVTMSAALTSFIFRATRLQKLNKWKRLSKRDASNFFKGEGNVYKNAFFFFISTYQILVTCNFTNKFEQDCSFLFYQRMQTMKKTINRDCFVGSFGKLGVLVSYLNVNVNDDSPYNAQ